MSESISTIRESSPSNEKKTSIFEHYSVLNDIIFVHENNLTIDEKRFYLEANVIKFLNEYVGEVPYTKIPLSLKPSGFEYAGINTSQAYWETALMTGEDSREYSDFIGYDRIQRSFINGEANVAAWISPPKIGNYGFVFLFSKAENHVNEHILRYKEKKGEFVASNHILSSLFLGKQYQRAKDFLEDPIAISTADIDTCIQKIMSLTGINSNTIRNSLEFETKVNENLKDWISLYTDEVIALSEEPRLNMPMYKEREKELQIILAGIFNRARDLKENKSPTYLEKINNLNPYEDNLDYSHYQRLAIYASAKSREVTVTGGSCPVSKKKSGGFDAGVFVSASDIIEALKAGQTLESFFESLSDDGENDTEDEYHEGYCVTCEEPENKVKKEVGQCNICKKCVKDKFS